MAKEFKIVISATDHATATIKKINASMAGLTRPIDDIRKIGNEIGKNPIAKGLNSIGSAAAGVASSISKVVGPMTGITGLGVIAGLAEAADSWGRLGLEIKNTSTSLGTTTSGLQSMRGAAKMAGLSAESLDSGLENVRQSMQDAKWGRYPKLIGLMDGLHINFKKTADGSVDAVEGIKDIADAMVRTKDVGAKHTIAQAFGIDALFPMLIKGRKGIEDYQKSIDSLGGIMSQDQIDRADKFTESLNKMSIAALGVKNSLGDKLIPILQPLVEDLTKYLTTNGKLIARDVAETVGGLVHPIDTWNKIPSFSLRRVIPPSPQEASGKIKYPDRIPLGIRSNNPLNMQPGGREAIYPTVEAGIGAALQNLMGKRYFGGGNDTVAGIVNTWTPPNAPGNSLTKTANYVAGVQASVGPGHLDSGDPQVMAKLISAMIVQENGSGTYDKAKMDSAVQHVLVEFKNAPPGTTATARASNGASIPVRVATAMPSMGGA